MAKKVLSVLDSGYRCTIEEQDDPAVWITHAMRKAGGEFSLLLCGSAVNYGVKGQDAGGLSFGGKKQTQPPRLDRDLGRLSADGVTVYAVEEDIRERGLDPAQLIDAVEPIPRAGMAKLFDAHDEVWHW